MMANSFRRIALAQGLLTPRPLSAPTPTPAPDLGPTPAEVQAVEEWKKAKGAALGTRQGA